MDFLQLKDKNIAVTGASSGIGKACAMTLSQLGANLLLIGRYEKTLCATMAELAGDGHQIRQTDLREDNATWLKADAQAMGGLDGLIHAAGIHQVLPLRALSLKSFEAVMQTNLHSAVTLSKVFRQKNVHTTKSAIVFISSIAASKGDAGHAAYCASKAGLESLGRALAIELAADNIRVNCIAPGMVKTKMLEEHHNLLSESQITAIKKRHPIGLGQPEDIANTAAFLVSAHAARWITGTTVTIDGGYSAG